MTLSPLVMGRYWHMLRAWLRRDDIRTPLFVGGMTRAAIIVLAFITIRLMGPAQPNPFLLHGGRTHPVKLVDNFTRFDSYWFLNIARTGYQYHGVQEQIKREARPHNQPETNITPFPLYPLLIWLAHQVIQEMHLSGLLIALFCYFAALIVFYRMVRQDWDQTTATRAILYLSIYPTGWFYNALYSESLYLLLTLLCLRRAREGNALSAGLYGMGASATRLAGGLVALPVMAELLFGDGTRLKKERIAPALLAGALTAMGWLTYFSYLYGLTGNFFIYFVAQRGWRKEFAYPWVVLWRLVRPGLLRNGKRLIHLATVLFFLPLTVISVREQRLSYSMLVALGLLMPLSVTNLLGLPRYLMVLYPIFILLARRGQSERVHQTVVVVFSLTLGVLMMPWLLWKYSY